MVTTLDYLVAQQLLDELARVDGLDPVAVQWIQHAAGHLRVKLDNSFRERPAIRTEQQAMALIRTIGSQLEEAGKALEWAAARLNKRGDGFGASQTHQQAVQVQRQAVELLGSE